MFKLNLKLMAVAALSAALLAGCGGGGGGEVGVAPPPANPPQTITAVVDFIKGLFVSNGENSDPIDINSLTLAVNDTAEPAPLE